MSFLAGKIIQVLKKINKEYIFLFSIVIFIGFLIYSANTIPQATPQEIAMTTFYPAPFGEFNEVVAKRLIDYDNPTTFVVDPNGVSVMHKIVLLQQAFTSSRGDLRLDGRIYGTAATQYYIDLNNEYDLTFDAGQYDFWTYKARVDAAPGSVFIPSLRCKAFIFMGASNPQEATNNFYLGKTVYDVAEGMAVAKDCDFGDVVSINTAEEDFLVKTRKKFDTNVAGVLSENPKLYLGATPDNAPIALAGIVKCKVNTENGPIKRGDLLVSSSEPGYAMRASAQEVGPGMLIGKALQPLKSGKDKIYILVNKQ